MADFNRRITVNDVIRRATGTMGLPKPTNAVTSSDATSRQMLDLLTECGQKLLGEYDWQDLIRTQTIVTDDVTTFPVPVDLERYLDDTGWNNTGRIPLIGPLNPQQWRMLQARQLGGTTLRLQYVVRAGNLELYFTPNPAQTLQVDYISRGWVQDANDIAVFRDNVTDAAELVLYDPVLIVAMLKYKWREAKGFDYIAAKKDYEQALAVSKYSDKPHSALPISGRSQFPYLGYVNIGDTRYGG